MDNKGIWNQIKENERKVMFDSPIKKFMFFEEITKHFKKETKQNLFQKLLNNFKKYR